VRRRGRLRSCRASRWPRTRQDRRRRRPPRRRLRRHPAVRTSSASSRHPGPEGVVGYLAPAPVEHREPARAEQPAPAEIPAARFPSPASTRAGSPPRARPLPQPARPSSLPSASTDRRLPPRLPNPAQMSRMLRSPDRSVGGGVLQLGLIELALPDPSPTRPDALARLPISRHHSSVLPGRVLSGSSWRRSSRTTQPKVALGCCSEQHERCVQR
jgi:hypothetical protein